MAVYFVVGWWLAKLNQKYDASSADVSYDRGRTDYMARCSFCCHIDMVVREERDRKVDALLRESLVD